MDLKGHNVILTEYHDGQVMECTVCEEELDYPLTRAFNLKELLVIVQTHVEAKGKV